MTPVLAKKKRKVARTPVLVTYLGSDRHYNSKYVGEGESKRLVINEKEAAVVRRIFEMFARGVSLKKIAKALNSERVQSPRSKLNNRGRWCPSAIRAMLKRELYKGEHVWNRSKFVKVPGTERADC